MKISQKIQDVLHESWHQTDSTTPFLKTLQTLIEEHKLSTFDMSFIQNWVQKKAHGRYCRADTQARALAVLYSNRLGEKTYSELAPILALPGVREAQRLNVKLSITCQKLISGQLGKQHHVSFVLYRMGWMAHV